MTLLCTVEFFHGVVLEFEKLSQAHPVLNLRQEARLVVSTVRCEGASAVIDPGMVGCGVLRPLSRSSAHRIARLTNANEK
jgi:hypothetical protein